MGVNVVSYALYGSDTKYTTGMVKNALQVPEIYPGYQCWVSYGESVPRDVLLELGRLPHVRLLPSALGKFARAALWSDPKIDIVLGRDADSRLSMREQGVVADWLNSGVRAYCAHDCRHHVRPLMNGLLGIRRPAEVLPDIAHLVEIWRRNPEATSDDEFASAIVYPRLASQLILYHSDACDYFRGLVGPAVRRIVFDGYPHGGFLGSICSPEQ